MTTQATPPRVITGASAGIGLALTAQWLSDGHAVVAVARNATRSDALIRLGSEYTQLQCLDVDLVDEQQISALGYRLKKQSSALGHIVNCAGVLHDAKNKLHPEKRLEDIRTDNLLLSFQLNAFAPILLARHLLPLMRTDQHGVYASLSARVGSISDNHLGGWYSYRAAKAAQNQLMRTLAIETRRRFPQVCVLSLHPGTTDTGLSKPFQRNVAAEKLFSASFSAARLAQIIDQSESKDHGRFIAWDGSDIPW